MDLKTRICAPPELNNFLQLHESFTATGHPSKGEGCDFIVESKNRATKMWMPAGNPTENQWLRVYRNLDRLDQVIMKEYKNFNKLF